MCDGLTTWIELTTSQTCFHDKTQCIKFKYDEEKA
jgi:hypothetical protein